MVHETHFWTIFFSILVGTVFEQNTIYFGHWNATTVFTPEHIVVRQKNAGRRYIIAAEEHSI